MLKNTWEAEKNGRTDGDNEKIPAQIKKRVLQRPDVFRKLASLDDDALDRVLALAEAGTPRKRRKPAGDG